ncbi:patatin-like phospholipase family protein [Rhizobium ruizarguesonis]
MGKSFKSGNGQVGYERLRADEKALVRTRRTVANVPNSPITTGLALSGGGIRSATFCLGVLQAISAHGLMPRFDYLSTVSGGSYIGSFFGALYVPARYRATSAPAPQRPSFNSDHPLQSPLGLEGVRRLRDAGRYLTPSGTSDAFYGAAIVIRNWASVQTVIGMTLLCFFMLVRVADAGINWAIDRSFAFPKHSLTLMAGVVISAALVFAFASSYWLTRRDWIPASRVSRIFSNLYFWMIILIDAVCIYLVVVTPLGQNYTLVSWEKAFYLFLASSVTIGFIAYVCAEIAYGQQKSLPGLSSANDDREFLIAAEDHVRSKLSSWLATSLIVLLSCAGLLCIDYLGSQITQAAPALYNAIKAMFSGEMTILKIVDFIASVWPGLVAIAPPLLSYIARQHLRRRNQETVASTESTKLDNRTQIVLVLVGSLVVALWAVIWSAVSHTVLLRRDLITPDPVNHAVTHAITILLALLVINLSQSLCFSFINLSSLSTFYAARLRRAYLGASSYGEGFTNVRQDDPEDTIRVEDYYKGITQHGAPLHLINVTIAETIAGSSNLVARDRKGKPMHLTPCGIVYEADRPGSFSAGFTGDGEELPLANWIAISGAAVSAAIGSGTSLGTSILATMSNVRLGYWWKARRIDGSRDLFWKGLKDTVQNYLFLELRGAFDGSRRERWYLTDGGHFENTGIYSLLQREVNFIVACDNGADLKYDMVDVLRLVQRARIDLEAHITFLDQVALDKKLGPNSPLQGIIGTFKELARPGDRDAPGGAVATLAEIEYRKTGKTGTILLVKPRLTFTEPPELLAYRNRAGGKDFPQQTTGDQFFDEEQWEAYRRLGEYSADKLFAVYPKKPGQWLPSTLKP